MNEALRIHLKVLIISAFLDAAIEVEDPDLIEDCLNDFLLFFLAIEEFIASE